MQGACPYSLEVVCQQKGKPFSGDIHPFACFLPPFDTFPIFSTIQIHHKNLKKKKIVEVLSSFMI